MTYTTIYITKLSMGLPLSSLIIVFQFLVVNLFAVLLFKIFHEVDVRAIFKFDDRTHLACFASF